MNPLVKLAIAKLGPRAWRWWRNRKVDETHEHPNGELLDKLKRAPGARHGVIVLPEGQTPCTVAANQTGGRFYCTRAAGHEGPCAAVPHSPLDDPTIEHGRRFTRVECPVCGRDVAVTAAGVTFLHRTRPGTRDSKQHVVSLLDKTEVYITTVVEPAVVEVKTGSENGGG